MMNNDYEILNVPPDASVEDIKRSFRQIAKRFHPDSNSGRPDSDRFSDAHRAYRALMKRSIGEYVRRSNQNTPYNKHAETQAESPAWRIVGITDVAGELHYSLDLSVPAIRNGIRISLPWIAEDACPRCLGAGHTLAPIFGGPHLVKVDCPKCGKTGVAKHHSHLSVDVTQQAIRDGRIRLEGKGHYSPTNGSRGDLIIEITPESYSRHLRG